MKVEPSISVVNISTVPTGAWIQFGKKYAIAAATARKPPQNVLAVYDKAGHKFIYTPSDIPSEVIIFNDALVLVPTLDSEFEGHPDGNATSELFLDGASPHVVIHVGADHRLLNLSTGIIESSTRTPLMIGFRNWSIGVRGANGVLITIEEFQPNPAAQWAKLAE